MNPTERRAVLRLNNGGFVPSSDAFASESHVRLSSEAGHSVSILATPADIEVFALGHALSEGWWDGNGTVPTVEVARTGEGLNAHLKGATNWEPIRESRLIHPSCGGCGESMASPPAGQRLSSNNKLDPSTLSMHLKGMKTQQPLFAATGGVHAAALIDVNHDIMVCEDIGRHSAVDKVIGRWLIERPTERPSALLLSGRCGWDLVAKAVRVGLKQIACVGAMSDAAAVLAREQGILLMGFATRADPQFVGPWATIPAKA